MSDEDLLIGGKAEETAQGQSGIQVPSEIVSISVFGVYPDETAIEQEFKLKLPRGIPNDQAALFVWDQVSKLGGLTTTGKAGEYNFYPLAVFKRLAMKFGTVVGVTVG